MRSANYWLQTFTVPWVMGGALAHCWISHQTGCVVFEGGLMLLNNLPQVVESLGGAHVSHSFFGPSDLGIATIRRVTKECLSRSSPSPTRPAEWLAASCLSGALD